MIHLYVGNGKGKSTAAAGLALRYAGREGHVLYTQFLKDGSSGEVRVLKKLQTVEVFPFPGICMFTYNMDDKTRERFKVDYSKYLTDIVRKVRTESVGLLVLDEVIDAVNEGLVQEEKLCSFLKSHPEKPEIVLTGRNPSDAIADLADYYTKFLKVRHPYDGGLEARKGIEF